MDQLLAGSASSVVEGAVTPSAESSRAQVLRALHNEHAQALSAYALRLTRGDHGHAQDVVQETLLRAWRHANLLDPARGSPRAWLFTTLRNIVIDEWRSRSTRPEVVTDEMPEQPSQDEAENVVQSWLLRDAIRQLSPEHREVIVECFYRGRTVPEAAERLGVPPGTVKSRTYYALRALRLALEKAGTA